MLLVKLRNAGELLWDSLDSRERMVVAYAAAWVGFAVALSLRQRSRARLRDEIVEELRHGS